MDEIFCSKKISVYQKMSLFYKARLDMRKDLFMILQKDQNSTCKGNISLMGISKKGILRKIQPNQFTTDNLLSLFLVGRGLSRSTLLQFFYFLFSQKRATCHPIDSWIEIHWCYKKPFLHFLALYFLFADKT